MNAMNNEIELVLGERLAVRFVVGAVLELRLRSDDTGARESTKRVRVTHVYHPRHETTDPVYTVVPLKGRRIDRRYSISHDIGRHSDYGWWFHSRPVLPPTTYQRRPEYHSRVLSIQLVEGQTVQQTTGYVPYTGKRRWGKDQREL
jgi:hypothetical protein